jgi:drug/metabolite transporter (DMT)-like permease
MAVSYRLRWFSQAMALFLFVYLMGVQLVQTLTRFAVHNGYTDPSTMITVRFQLPVVVALAAALWVRFVNKSENLLKPTNMRAQLGRSLAQGGQSLFILLAATELTGAMQSALSLTLVPTWVILVTFVTSWFTGKKPKATQFIASVFYAAASTVLTLGTQSLGGGNMKLGLLFMVASGFCTAVLQVLTQSESDVSLITSTFWQNLLGAILTVPLWFVAPGFGYQRASLPFDEGWVAFLLIVLVATASVVQQVGLLKAYRLIAKAEVAQINTQRGAQQWFGVLADLAFFQIVPNASVVVALVIAAVAMWVGWKTTRPKQS